VSRVRLHFLILPPLFVPHDNYRIGVSSLTYIEDCKIDVPLTVWWTKGGRSPTTVHQITNNIKHLGNRV